MAPYSHQPHDHVSNRTPNKDGNGVWRPKKQNNQSKNSRVLSKTQFKGRAKTHNAQASTRGLTTKKRVAEPTNLRALCAKMADGIFSANQNLTEVLRKGTANLNPQDNALVAEILYGVMRHRLKLEFIVGKLLKHPLKSSLQLLKNLLLIGIYQLEYTQIPAYAAVNETVEAANTLGLQNYRSLINALLHEYTRQKDELILQADKSYETAWSCPQWLILELKAHYKEQLPHILAAMNQHPPMWIRVNKQKYTCVEYQVLLKEQGIESSTCASVPFALKLATPVAVDKLPGFKDGAVFVQDAAAQYASILLEAKPGDVVLDCCCAPGGKTTHIRELYPKIADLVAIDSQEDRLNRVHENLKRMHQDAKVICYDAGAPTEKWSPYPQYDRILLDAPCSATGVIRRHPDIKWLRTPEDVAEIMALQKRILENIWSMLKPGGTLVYATCSIIYGENASHIKAFLTSHDDAILVPISEHENALAPGLQRFPGDEDMDGFYYAKLMKKAHSN